MDLKTYKIIVETINQYALSKEALKAIKEQHSGVSHDTLFSILSSEYQKRMRRNHIKSTINKNKYWETYQEGIRKGESPGIIVKMSKQYHVSPCLIAKLILQKFFELKEDKPFDGNVNIYIRDTASIPDMDLAYEIYLCTLYDNMYSPYIETMKQSLGQQYEIKLHNEAVSLGLAFRDEEHLRKSGYDKTPDIKLDVPVAVDGSVINWIESKALFGDEEAHQDYMKKQYLSYWNRFGPGLVIYWFGYLETIVDQTENRFLIRDHLPTNIVYLTPPDFNSLDIN